MARNNDTTSTKGSTTTTGPGANYPSGTRLEAFTVREREGKDAIWVRTGSAFINKDGSINVYLDVLPLDGKLHLRVPQPKPDAGN